IWCSWTKARSVLSEDLIGLFIRLTVCAFIPPLAVLLASAYGPPPRFGAAPPVDLVQGPMNAIDKQNKSPRRSFDARLLLAVLLAAGLAACGGDPGAVKERDYGGGRDAK